VSLTGTARAGRGGVFFKGTLKRPTAKDISETIEGVGTGVKGTLSIYGEFYWYGDCAAAAAPTSTKFNMTASDGSNIAVGDPVCVRDGYADYVYTTVKGTVDKGSNIWEVELNAPLPTGNIGSGDYYTICKTKIVTTTGSALDVSKSQVIYLYGLFMQSGDGTAVSVSTTDNLFIMGCFVLGNTTNSIVSNNAATGYIKFDGTLTDSTIGNNICVSML
jgi:hypothetical protein